MPLNFFSFSFRIVSRFVSVSTDDVPRDLGNFERV